MSKVVYIAWEHLSEKIERDWYISFLHSRGVAVEYWDVTTLLFGLMGSPSLERDYVTDIGSYQHLENLICRNVSDNIAYVLIVNYESRFYRLFRMLTRYDCKLYFIHWGYFPIRKRWPRLLRMLIANPRRPLAIVSSMILTKFSHLVGLVKPLDVVFVAGYGSMPRCPPSTKLIPFNLCDYDNYLIAKDTAPLIHEPYCVFLDINLGYHPDVKIAFLGEHIDPGRYMESLNTFFELIEKQMGVKVVIAAHPISNYKSTDFGGRMALKGVTPELVKDAEFVISHHSASLSYAVLNRKPVIFIHTACMEDNYKETVVAWIREIALFLGAPVYNIDLLGKEQGIPIPLVDEAAYESYKYGYLTTRETEERLNKETFFRELTA